ncbi:uncharacterized protein LY89DRAFT_130376 [Mollisia scopiformis]|uniref:Uncharacterized protein n=1 Tax=Mollisia scopiformis TaxID=149040 RepID=A0A194X1R5_MOLSC|nr:uncharacterized protein LY89DRAFT_130376 [Mollisia scopiformis]KUJ14138.1 hypothetical protein LY89DRAFT_130376 [Mollisia scopiformis]
MSRSRPTHMHKINRIVAGGRYSLSMASPADPMPVINTLTKFVDTCTAYLSTLPHRIEPVEELVAVISVIGSLFFTLTAQINRFPRLHLLSTYSLLAEDILHAISLVENRVNQAKHLRLFEPTDDEEWSPYESWFSCNGSEVAADRLWRHMCVEKSRVRVLIDAVTWVGLRSSERNEEEEVEYQDIRKRLGVVAPRLVGIWRDYVARLKIKYPQVAKSPVVDGASRRNLELDPVLQSACLDLLYVSLANLTVFPHLSLRQDTPGLEAETMGIDEAELKIDQMLKELVRF